MMQGVVNQNREATIALVVGNANRQTQLIDAVIDTGYTGFLSLLRKIIILNLPWTSIDRGTLGDGSEATFTICQLDGEGYPIQRFVAGETLVSGIFPQLVLTADAVFTSAIAD